MTLEYVIRQMFDFKSRSRHLTQNVDPSFRNFTALVVPYKGEFIEVPCIGGSDIISSIAKRIVSSTDSSVDEIRMPITTANNWARTYSTVVTTFKNTIVESYTNYGTFVRKVRIPDLNILLYIGKGIVLDKDFNPIMLSTIRYRKVMKPITRSSYMREEVAVPYQARIYINNNLSEHDTTGPLHKFFHTTLINSVKKLNSEGGFYVNFINLKAPTYFANTAMDWPMEYVPPMTVETIVGSSIMDFFLTGNGLYKDTSSDAFKESAAVRDVDSDSYSIQPLA